MLERKLNGRYVFITLFFSVFVYPWIKVIYMLLTQKVGDENGDKLSPVLDYFMAFVLIFFGCFFFSSLVGMFIQMIYRRNRAFEITEEGIENTFIFTVLFAFLLFRKVKLIPWSAVKGYEKTDKTYILNIDTSQIKASRVAKVYLRFVGFPFCKPFIATITDEEFQMYILPRIQNN